MNNKTKLSNWYILLKLSSSDSIIRTELKHLLILLERLLEKENMHEEEMENLH